MAFSLPPLPYPNNALEPYIDAQTMEIHHDRHHKAYVDNLNKALEKHPDLQNKRIDELLRDINQVPESIRTAVRNNGGGHANHSMFWEIMVKGGGGEPSGAVADEIKRTFGDLAAFKQKLKEAALGRFGSGWAWLVWHNGKAQITNTANQDSPYMEGHVPILGIDVWEHAYYLKYQNKRGDYIDAWWNVINWPAVAKRYEHAKSSRQ